MLFSWDPGKARKNIQKHGVSFELAQTVFDDPFQVSILDEDIHHEERWVTMGRSANDFTLVVVHTHRIPEREEEVIRIISARRATRKERKQYEERI